MPVDNKRVEEIFLTAAEIPADKRSTFLDEACGEDAELRAAIDRLLAASAEPASIFKPFINPAGLETLVLPKEKIEQNDHSDIGTVLIGRYTLLEEIGEGGMGTVWMARQSEPVKRLVAVKMVRPGMDSKMVLARFDAERQALALMDHPNIARVLDAGETADGRPFFVMDLVKGIPITHFCDSRKLTPRERLELFVPVCHAIQHAHQKGIIHRDIKPSNVLVALYDDRPVPKVIDFGVAKATGQSLTEQTLHTGFGTVVGTPLYMSPEQATFNNMDVDTRSDLYSLGVLLYELLTGTQPFTKKEFEKAGMLEMLRLVREEEPPRPSTRLSTADALPTIAANRGTEPKKLTGMLRNELDWIVMKALEKDRTRRYETANGFASDVLRYLSGEPVKAVPPSASYRLRKFVRKNRGPVATTLTIIFLLLAGVAISIWLAVRAINAEGLARDAADIANEREEGERKAKHEAVEARDLALKRLSQIEKGNAVLSSIFEDLNIWTVRESGEPLESILSQRLLKATRELEGESLGDTLAVAVLQRNLGDTLASLGYPSDATPLLIKSRDTCLALLGPEANETLLSLGTLANIYSTNEKRDLALPMFQKIVSIRKAKNGPEHADTLEAMSQLGWCYWQMGKYQEALPIFQEVLEIRTRKDGPDYLRMTRCQHPVALCHLEMGNYDKAEPILKEVLVTRIRTVTINHAATLNTMNDLAICYSRMGKFDLAVQLHQETLNLRQDRLGTYHPHTIASMDNLAQCYWDMGNREQALALNEKILKLRKVRPGEKHPQTLNTMHEVAYWYKLTGKLEAAVALFEETIKLRREVCGSDNEATLSSIGELAICYRDMGRLDLALPLLREAASGVQKLNFKPSCSTWIINALIACHEQLKQLNEVTVWSQKWVLAVKEKHGEDSIEYASALANLGFELLQLKKWSEAQSVLSKSLTIRQDKEPNSWMTFNSQSMLGEALLRLGKLSEAEPLILLGYEGMKERKKTIPTREMDRLIHGKERMVSLYEAIGKADMATKLRKELPLKAKPEENLLINGSFEEGPKVDTFLSLDPGSTALPGWVVIRGQIDLIGPGYMAAAHGKHCLDLHGSPGFGGVRQKFKTEPGKRYQVAFSLAGVGDIAVKKTAVSAAGQTQVFSFDSTGRDRYSLGWEKMVWEFTASSSETTLEIYTLEMTEGFDGPVLDDIWVLPVPDKR